MFILFFFKFLPSENYARTLYVLLKLWNYNPLEDKLIRMALWDSTLVKAQQQRNVTFSIYEKRQTVLVPANL